MRKLTFVVLAALAGFGQSAHGKCKVSFSVERVDALGNISLGLAPKDARWFEQKVQKKYPEVCYAPPVPGASADAPVPPVFILMAGRASAYQMGNTPVTGRTTGSDGSSSTTTTNIPVVVPSSVGVYRLAVAIAPEGKWKTLHVFQQAGYTGATYAGIPLWGGKSRHPIHTLLEEAARWVEEGGLTNPSEDFVP